MRILIIILLLALLLAVWNCSTLAEVQVCTNRTLEGFNWYSEKIEKKQDKKLEQSKTEEQAISQPEAFEDLPEYEKNIRKLQDDHNKAHREALDNPILENLFKELLLEREMINKSEEYGIKRVIASLMLPQMTNMREHSNILHRSVQEQVEDKENFNNMSKLSKDWGLVMQVSNDCAHCHSFAPIVLKFAKEYGFQLIAASKDGTDFKGIEGVRDHGQMLVFNPKRETPILYLVKNDGQEVLPISRGINSADQIIININNINKHMLRLF